MRKNNQKGFSLVEILATMVILGVLMSLAVATYSRYRKESADKSYKMMSENAATAGEEYFLDNLSATEVSFEQLTEDNYFERAVDPINTSKVCNGSVRKYSTRKEVNTALEITTLKVVVECEKYESCVIYPSRMKCSKDDGIITDGTNESYYMGLDNYNFGNNMALVIRLKFNELGKWIEYFGNWENAGGGLGLESETDYFYFNLYSQSNDAYYKFLSNQAAYKNRWYIVAGVLENGKMKLYIDGELQTNSAGGTYTELPGGNVKPSEMGILVGGNPQPENSALRLPAPITVSDALIFNRALTQTEITNYFSKPSEPIYFNGDALVNKKF